MKPIEHNGIKMKSVFVRTLPNWPFKGRYVGIKSLKFEELSYDYFYDVCWLGYMLALESDYIVTPQKIDCIKNYNNNELDEYDVIITVFPFLKTKKPNQTLYYLQPEPPELDRSTPWTKEQQAEYPYDYFLDNYHEGIIGNHLSCHFHYDLNFFQQFKNGKKEPNRILLTTRSIKYCNPMDLKNLGFPVEIEKSHISLESGIRFYHQFLKDLSLCEYLLNLCDNPASGQIIAEASMLDVISFARPHKLFSKLLLPEFCWISGKEDFLCKVDILNKNGDMKRDILNQIGNNCKKLDMTNFKSMINSTLSRNIAVPHIN